MSIRQRGNRWQVDVYLKDGRTRLSCASKKEALAEHARLLAIKAGNNVVPFPAKSNNALTLSELLDLTSARLWAGTRSETVQTRTGLQIIKKLGPALPVSQVTIITIDSFITSCKREGNKPTTINRKLAVLHQMLRYAFERGYLTEMPHFKRERAQRDGRKRYLSFDEEAQILELASQDLADFISVAIDTGGRLSEILNLKKQDIDNKKVIFWETKSGKNRAVPITKRVQGILEKRKQKASLWPAHWTAKKISIAWAKLRTQMNLEHDKDFVFHCTRHTCATRLISVGASLIEVQQWLGHSKMQQTAVYAHLEEDSYYKLVDGLEQQRVI
ncbi:tyrosine-type recombinase/integrase [Zooshikella sp. RANM57]|uniref:tyrosine-type recombinase/integrase n=1 Tax=Zooshikella sp. RANM57 TaxID=3425863 RepID=UPI003D6F564D